MTWNLTHVTASVLYWKKVSSRWEHIGIIKIYLTDRKLETLLIQFSLSPYRMVLLGSETIWSERSSMHLKLCKFFVQCVLISIQLKYRICHLWYFKRSCLTAEKKTDIYTHTHTHTYTLSLCDTDTVQHLIYIEIPMEELGWCVCFFFFTYNNRLLLKVNLSYKTALNLLMNIIGTG